MTTAERPFRFCGGDRTALGEPPIRILVAWNHGLLEPGIGRGLAVSNFGADSELGARDCMAEQADRPGFITAHRFDAGDHAGISAWLAALKDREDVRAHFTAEDLAAS